MLGLDLCAWLNSSVPIPSILSDIHAALQSNPIQSQIHESLPLHHPTFEALEEDEEAIIREHPNERIFQGTNDGWRIYCTLAILPTGTSMLDSEGKIRSEVFKPYLEEEQGRYGIGIWIGV